MLPPDGLLSRSCEESKRDLARALDAQRDCLVVIDVSREVDLRQALALAQALGEFAAPHLERCGGVIATGGDTARALLAALHLPGIELLGEVEPGVPLGLLGTLPIVTKAGAFGTPQTLLRARAALHALLLPATTQGDLHA
jgi:4-hydroxythreonine-4-phosphate dehydrogenase